MRALILDSGTSRGALAAARSLAGAGWAVGVATPTGSGLASRSRSVSFRHRVTAPADPGFVANLAPVSERYDVVLGAGDDWALGISANRDELGLRMALPPHCSMEAVFDKLALAAAADQVGVAVPRTVAATPNAIAEWEGVAVVKPRRHCESGGRIEAVLVSDHEGITAAAGAVRAAGAEPVLQECVNGSLMSLAVVLVGERVVARAQQRAERLWPHPAGVSARAVTLPVDEVLAERLVALLKALHWQGLVQAQYLVPRDGVPRLVDLNGRVYGSLSLAVAAGADLPALWAAGAAGQSLPAQPVDARAGVTYSWVEGDLRRALALRDGGLVRDVATTLVSAARTGQLRSAVRDPAPGLSHVGALAQRGLSKVRRKVQG